MDPQSAQSRVLAAAFVLAVFGWGLGFYGPPVYLQAVLARTGWPVGLVSAAVTAHHLVAAATVFAMPQLHARWGIGPVCSVGMIFGATGVVGWSLAQNREQLFAAAVLSGLGWGCTGAAAITAVVSQWYGKDRAQALGTAYNGATIGGAIFSVGWPWLIGIAGFFGAACLCGAAAVIAVTALSGSVFRWSPEVMGNAPNAAALPEAAPREQENPTPSGAGQLPRGWRLRTLAIGMSLGLFVQIGVLSHLFALVTPRLGAGTAGWLLGVSVLLAVVGRSLAWRLGVQLDVHPRKVAATFLIFQALGSALFAMVDESGFVALVAACVLFGLGIGNATSLGPIAVHHDFPRHQAARATAHVVSTALACYAFAPVTFGLLLQWGDAPHEIGAGTRHVFYFAGLLQLLAAAFMLSHLAPRQRRAGP